MRSRIRSIVRIAAAVTLLAVTSCGGGGGDAGSGNPNPTGPQTPNPPSGPSVPTTASITMQGGTDMYGYDTHSFSPDAVTIARNGVVTWTNTTGVEHNVTFTGTGAPAAVPNHTSGSNARTFTTNGVFSYNCTNHPGMAGVVTVQ